MKPSRALALAGLLIVVLVALRIGREPVPVYGDSGAGWIEHMARLETLLALERVGWTGPLDWIRAADGLYPPGLHLLSLPLSIASGHSPRVVALTGLGWLGGLAIAVGALGTRWKAGAVAATAVLLLPALHGTAARYYYDLPMVTLVWASAAVLVRSRRAAGGALAALLFGGACLVKWSALPLGLPVLGAAAVLARSRRAVGVAVLSTAVLGAVLVGLDLPSFGAMGGATFQPPPGVVLTAAQRALADWGPPGQALVMLDVGLTKGILSPRLGFYLARSVQSCLSPALGLALAPGLALAVVRGTPREHGAALVLALPVVAFLVLLVPPLDERFLLGLLPAVALAHARGWVTMPARLQPWALGTLLVVGAAVAVDVHGGTLRTTDQATDPASTGHQLPWRWGAGASIDRRGWAPARDSPSPRMALRGLLWSTLRACPWRRVGGRDRLLNPAGDLNWWGHQLRLGTLGGDPTWSWTPDGPGEVWLRPHPASAWEPAAAVPAGLVLEGILRDPEGGPGIELWRQTSAPGCAAPALEPPLASE